MSNLLIASPGLSDAGTYTDPGGTGSGIANLKTIQPSDAFIITGNAGHFHLDLGAARSIDTVMFLHYGTTSSLTRRIRGATSDANLTASPGFDSGVESAYATGSRPVDQDGLTYAANEPLLSIRRLSPAQTFQWWRIDFNDVGATLYSIGRVYFSKAWQPAINIDFGWSVGFIDSSLRNRGPGGQTFVKNMGRLRVIDFSLEFGSETDLYGSAYELNRTRGGSKDVLVVRDPDATTHLHRQSVYGLMTDLRPIVNKNFDIFTQTFRIEELTV